MSQIRRPRNFVNYSTRSLPRDLRDRMRVIALAHPELRTMEAVLNRALIVGLPQLEAQLTVSHV
jgi:hypothetical protein